MTQPLPGTINTFTSHIGRPLNLLIAKVPAGSLAMVLLALAPLVQALAAAPEPPPWRDIATVQVNAEPPRASFLPYENRELARAGEPSASRYFRSLDGKWSFRFSESPGERPRGFWQRDYDTAGWPLIDVPSVWERQGYGYPIYVNHAYPFNAEPFSVPVDQQNHVGAYVRDVSVPSHWNDRRIFIQFGAVSSAFTLWVNGRQVGFSQGSRTPAEFDVTDYVSAGSNRIAVEVTRFSDGSWLENQDSWSLSGIFRSVSLVARPHTYIRDIFARSSLDRDYRDGVLKISTSLVNRGAGELSAPRVRYALFDGEGVLQQGGRELEFVDGHAKNDVDFVVKNVDSWSAEQPVLYELLVELLDGDSVLEVVRLKIGFRSVELSNGRVLVNGKAITFKGVNLHEFHEQHGYVVDRETLVRDFQLMKAANINAIRTAHYPQQPLFYELADHYGFYIVDEANLETHLYRNKPQLAPARRPEWAFQMLDRSRRMFERDKNHPSVIIWSPGNESGMGPNITAIYQWLKRSDSTRLVQYADDTYVENDGVRALQSRWEFGKASDFLSAFYPSPWELEAFAQTRADETWIMGEYWHSMGNSMGNGRDYWRLINRHSNLQGGFIWDWVDQGLLEFDEQGRRWWAHGGDYGPAGVPSSANFVHNGLLFPDRTPKPAYYEVKRAHQPVEFVDFDRGNGIFRVHNRFDFIGLGAFSVFWELLADGVQVDSGIVKLPDIPPGASSKIHLGRLKPRVLVGGAEYHLNLDLRRNEAIELLGLSHSYASQQFQMPYERPMQMDQSACDGAVEIISNSGDDDLVLVAGDIRIHFSRARGVITGYEHSGLQLLVSDLELEFWRAMTDNDYGQFYRNDYGYSPANWDQRWRGAGKRSELLSSSVVEHPDGSVELSADFEISDSHADSGYGPAWMARVSTNYHVYGNGLVVVGVSFRRNPSFSMPPRLGVRLALDRELGQLSWFGRGPHENYSDRNWSASFGYFQSSIEDQYVSYLRPQENGYKTDVRWFSIGGIKGRSLLVAGLPTTGFSALPFPLEALEPPVEEILRDPATVLDRYPMHANDLPPVTSTHVHIDAIQAGVGGDNSWGKRPYVTHMAARLEHDLQFAMIGGVFDSAALPVIARKIRNTGRQAGCDF